MFYGGQNDYQPFFFDLQFRPKITETSRKTPEFRAYDCGCLVFPFLFKIARPSNNFEFSKLPFPF